MNKAWFVFFIVIAAIVSPIYTQIEVSGVNLAEIRVGRVPQLDTTDFGSWYNRGTVNFAKGDVSLGITAELYTSPYSRRNYLDLSQVSFKYTGDQFKVNLGNFYPTLGRGILLRSFFIPGAVIESFSYRTPNYFHRDVLGGQVEWGTKKLTVGILSGSVLNNFFPPTFGRDRRRVDHIASTYVSYKFGKAKVEGIGFSTFDSDRIDFFGDLNISYPFHPNWSWYIEGAAKGSDERAAFYTGLNYTKNSLGVSLEYKNYKNFILGNSINEPPALVKQHTYRTLNRSTHVPNPLNEEGYQLDVHYEFGNGSALNFNNALAYNNFGRTFLFQEYFVEYSWYTENDSSLKIFADFAEDPFKGESRRISTGLYSDWSLKKKMTLLQEFEFQTFRRTDANVYNLVFGGGLRIGRKWSSFLLFEYSNDPLLLAEGSDNRYWIGSSSRYQINPGNSLTFFIGSRRGGPACTSGVCYEILDFRGIELRVNSRF